MTSVTDGRSRKGMIRTGADPDVRIEKHGPECVRTLTMRNISPELPHSPQLIHRPVPEHRLAIDQALADRAEFAAITRHRPMVAQDEEVMLRHCSFRVGTGIGIGRGNVVLAQGLIVHVYLAPVDAYTVASDSDYALDVALRRITRITEDHNIPWFNRFQPVHELIDEDPFLIFERRHHAHSLNLHGLVEEDNHEGRDRQRNDQIAHPDADPGSDADGRRASRG